MPDQTLSELKNLGPKSQLIMAQVGITSLEHLKAAGSIAAFAMARRHSARVSLNLLWALEGALSGLPWQEVAREHRTSLLLALEQYEKQPGNNPGADGLSR